MEVNIKIPALEKLVDHVASGIGGIADPLLVFWKAEQATLAKQIIAQGDAEVLQSQAKAQSEARKLLVSQDTDISGEIDISKTIDQRIQFQEQKRQINIQSVVTKAAHQLGDKEVANNEPDHDWTARFFNEAQDVSSEEMQLLWAEVLAGEVEQAGSTSIRTLGILRNLNQSTAHRFRRFCSACVSLSHEGNIIDARVPSLGGDAALNSPNKYGLSFLELITLNEHGLIISDFGSWGDFQFAIGLSDDDPSQLIRFPFSFQDQNWVLIPENQRSVSTEFKLHGVMMTESGKELLKIIDLESMEEFTRDLIDFFHTKNLQMTKVSSSVPIPIPRAT